jgi:hypothetical protein
VIHHALINLARHGVTRRVAAAGIIARVVCGSWRTCRARTADDTLIYVACVAIAIAVTVAIPVTVTVAIPVAIAVAVPIAVSVAVAVPIAVSVSIPIAVSITIAGVRPVAAAIVAAPKRHERENENKAHGNHGTKK